MSIYLKKIFFSNSFKSIDSIRFKYKSVHIFTIKFSFQKLKKDFPIGIIFIESFTQKKYIGTCIKKRHSNFFQPYNPFVGNFEIYQIVRTVRFHQMKFLRFNLIYGFFCLLVLKIRISSHRQHNLNPFSYFHHIKRLQLGIQLLF